jgi:exopolysaccharide biosynthesis polyprenyl glycosylphosphotransferase
MFPQTKRLFQRHAAKLFDHCILVTSFGLATASLYSSPKTITLAGFMAMRIRLGTILLFVLLMAIWHGVFVMCGLYESKRLTTWRAETYELLRATCLASILLLGLARTFHIFIVQPSFVLLFWIFCTSLLISSRLGARSILLTLRRHGRNTRYLLIIGTNSRAMEFAQRVSTSPELGYKIVGFVDDDWHGIRSFDETGNVRCCDFAGLAEFLRHSVVDEAAIYLPLRSYYKHSAQLTSLGEHGIAVRFDSQIFNLGPIYSSAADMDGNPEALVFAGKGQGFPTLIKRAFDVVFSTVLLILLAPVFLVAAILVRWTSPGPAFFGQTRVGLNKRQFRMYKFRTMNADAEQIQDQLLALNEMTGPVFKIKNDPRITPLGRVLRKTSIDELPQLFNVLKGDMSLVGPRAMSLRDYQLFDQDWQRRRFSVKPGITCLWQVNGRNSVPFETWMELDMQYIDKWSLWLDFKILAQTIPAVVKGSGAA